MPSSIALSYSLCPDQLQQIDVIRYFLELTAQQFSCQPVTQHSCTQSMGSTDTGSCLQSSTQATNRPRRRSCRCRCSACKPPPLPQLSPRSRRPAVSAPATPPHCATPCTACSAASCCATGPSCRRPHGSACAPPLRACCSRCSRAHAAPPPAASARPWTRFQSCMAAPVGAPGRLACCAPLCCASRKPPHRSIARPACRCASRTCLHTRLSPRPAVSLVQILDRYA